MIRQRRLRISVGSGVLVRLLALNTGRGHCRARIFAPTAPRTELPGRGADRGYSFVSMIHHTARAGLTDIHPITGRASPRAVWWIIETKE